MSGAERGRATGQHEQPRQQSVLFTACVRDVQQMTPPPTRFVAADKIQPWDIEAYVQAFFAHANRIQIEYEVECDGCGLIVPRARTVWCGDKRMVLCAGCQDDREDKIRATMAQDED